MKKYDLAILENQRPFIFFNQKNIFLEVLQYAESDFACEKIDISPFLLNINIYYILKGKILQCFLRIFILLYLK